MMKNAIHEADLLFLPNDQGYKYALTLVDVATRFKAAQPLKTKTSSEVAKAFDKIYKTTPLKKPKQLSVDKGKEFHKEVTKYFVTTEIVRSHDLTHIVERFNRTLAEHIFSIQYHKEISAGGTNREWIKDLQTIIDKLNDTKTRLIGLSPNEAIKLNKPIKQYKKEHKHPDLPDIKVHDYVRYLLRENDSWEGLEGRRRATDPIWSTKVYMVREIKDVIPPAYYYLDKIPKRHFLREELQLVTIYG